jgi:HicB family
MTSSDAAVGRADPGGNAAMRIQVDDVFKAFDGALALIEDERQRDTFQRLLSASRDSVQRAVHDVVRQVVDEVNEVAAGVLELELVYRPDGLELRTSRASLEEPVEDEVELGFDAEDIDRLTLRLPAELKDIAAAAAEQAGISLNTWLTRLVTREAVHRTRADVRQARGRRRGPGQSLKGWIGG